MKISTSASKIEHVFWEQLPLTGCFNFVITIFQILLTLCAYCETRKISNVNEDKNIKMDIERNN